MQPNHRRLAGRVLDGDNIEAQRAVLDVAFAEKIMGGAEKDFVFFLADA
jgi:hypothetical protein